MTCCLRVSDVARIQVLDRCVMSSRVRSNVDYQLYTVNVMKPARHLQRWVTVVIFVFLVVLGGILAIRRLGLASFPIPPIAFVSVAYSEDIVAAHLPPGNTTYGKHNFRRPNHVITEYDDDVAARLATLVKRRATAADPGLIRLIVDMLDPPSAHMVKMSRQLFSTPQSREVDKILEHRVRPLVSTCNKY